MNSAKKKSDKKEEPIFKFDPETGKHIPLPLYRNLCIPPETTANQGVSSNTKRKIVLAPLKVTDLDFEEDRGVSSNKKRKTGIAPPKPTNFEELSGRGAKIRKTDSVRKGLFNVPLTRSSYSSVGRRSLSRRKIDNTKRIQQKKNPCELSPLLDMEEVEEELLNKKVLFKGYPFRTPSKPSMKFTKGTKCSPHSKKIKLEKTNTQDAQKTPESISSNETEFLELEKMCCVAESNKENHSPISSVCNLLEGTVLGSVKKSKNCINNTVGSVETVISNVENILDENERAFNRYKINHAEHMAKIVELIENDKAEYNTLIAFQEANKKRINDILDKWKLVCAGTEAASSNKKNSSVHRRSIRLLNKSPVQNSKTKVIVSPGIMRSGDLRKTTLTKNLVAKTQQYQIQSPRIQKALDMYNSMRGDISILTTPKLDRKALMESPKSSNMSRILSRRVQSQCLLLQDTPIHN